MCNAGSCNIPSILLCSLMNPILHRHLRLYFVLVYSHVTFLSGNLLKTQEGFTFKFEFVAKGSQSQDTSELIISGERKVKKEELHFKVKAKDVEPNQEKEENVEVSGEGKANS